MGSASELESEASIIRSMSLVHCRSRLLGVAPEVIVHDGLLIARTNDVWTALSLFSYRRELYVDARRSRIMLRERRFWRTRETRLDFDAVDHVEYGYGSFSTSFFTTVQSGRLSLQSADSLERFRVALVLKNGERLPLFSFVGDGERMTGGLGVLLGDSLVDFSGEQEAESYRFVRHLQRLTGFRLGPALAAGLEAGRQKCPSCGHENAPRARCLYCGAALA